MKKRFKSISFSQYKTRLKRLFNKATWQDLKERYHRWRLNPFKYEEIKLEAHHCNNCDLDYDGDYCPRCGQKGSAGRIGWNTIREGVMDIWGLGNRSMLYSLWQLVFRPGYFVGDYISGKRQVSFPPVKMLFILTVIYAVVAEWFFPTVLGITVDEDVKKAVSETNDNIINSSVGLLREHRAWSMLLVSSFLIIPVWIFFRYAPRHTKHTLPEGFFISVFVCVLTSLYNFIGVFFSQCPGMKILLFFALVIVFIAFYKQLFGYSVWGTLWRLGGVIFCASWIAVLFIIMVGYAIMITFKKELFDEDFSQAAVYGIPFIALFILLNFGIAHIINKYSIHRARKRQAAQKAEAKVVAEDLAQTD